ncbi:MAG: TIGR01620 family protein [Venatoribacter sp.]
MTDTHRPQGKTFLLDDEPSASLQPERKATFFVPDEQALNSLPEAISGENSPSQAAPLAGLTLEKLPLKGLRTLVVSGILLLISLGGWQLYDSFMAALDVHWSLAAALGSLIALLSGAAMLTLFNYLKGQANLQQVEQFQLESARLIKAKDLGCGKIFIAKLSQYYQGKPQHDYLTKSLNSLPDYSNDSEAIAHLERSFLQVLDKEAERRISAFSLQTAVGVSVSAWASVDMLIALWRNLKMVDEIAQIYGIRPSLASRLRLLKKITHQLVFVGTTEMAIDAFFDEMGSDSLVSVLGARSLQGVGAGIYTIRIGIAAMQACRPIEFSQAQKPKFKQLVAGVLSEVKRLFSGKRSA